jgi:monofunctional biosynthetic peptidoglycan transglycosylase
LNISVNLQKVIASEDGSFLIHNGFDFKAMQKSKGNERGRKIKGGTISQQTAKKCISMAGS